MSVCMSAHEHFSGTTYAIVTKILCLPMTAARFFWQRCDTLSTSGFIHDVTFAHNGPYGGISMPLQRVTSLRRLAQVNAPAASHWLRRDLDDGGRRD